MLCRTAQVMGLVIAAILLAGGEEAVTPAAPAADPKPADKPRPAPLYTEIAAAERSATGTSS